MEWNYWGSSHGKGPHDGAKTCLKQTLPKEQLKSNGILLQNAQDVVSFLRSLMSLGHATYENVRLHVDQNFIEIKIGEMNRTHGYNCQIIEGFRSLHFMQSVSNASNVLLENRKFSCFVTSVLMIFQKGIVVHPCGPLDFSDITTYSFFYAHCDIDIDGIG
jgi:hypothetical protein